MSAEALTAKDDVSDDGLPSPRRQIALAALLIAIAMIVVDSSSVNVALPSIAHSFGALPADVIRIVSAHQITMVALLLPCAALAEKFGYRRLLMTGVVLFVVSSVVCLFANSLPNLIAARAALGLSGACIFGATTALLRLSQPRHLLGRTMGTMGMVVAVSTGLGPGMGMTILTHADWRWIFAPNLVFGLTTLVLCLALPVVRDPSRRFSLVSAGLAALTFTLLIVGIGNAVGRPVVAAACVAAAIVLATLLIVWERPRPFPLLPVDLFRRPQFAFAIAGSACLFSAQMSAFIALPFHFQPYFGNLQTGILLTVWPIAVAIMAPWAGRLSDRISASTLCAFGSALLAMGLILLAVSPTNSVSIAVAALLMCGAGFGLFQTPNNRAMLLAVPINRIGAAAGVQATTRQFGHALGAAFAALAFALSATFGGTISLGVSAAMACAALLVSTVPRGQP